jgi:hypothetical protein
MYTHWKLAWMLAAIVIVAAAMPGPVKADDRDRDGGRASIRIVVRDKDDDDDVRALGYWYGSQADRFGDIDMETGLRVGNLLQLVVDVDRDHLMVVDRQGMRHTVLLPNRAVIAPVKNQGWNWDTSVDTRLFGIRIQGGPRFTLSPGDLVIVQGYLQADGSVWATNVRVYGRSYGWDDRGYNRSSFHGFRAYGEVRSVDTYRNSLVIEANNGRQTVKLRGDADVMLGDGHQPLSFLRRGDRVVFYSDDQPSDTINAYRLVLLKDNDRYPDGDTPYYTDPDYRTAGDRGHGGNDRMMLEGQLDTVTTGGVFNVLDFRANSGQHYTLRAFKGLDATGRNGEHISLNQLRMSDRLRIYYSESNGTQFAQRIEVL